MTMIPQQMIAVVEPKRYSLSEPFKTKYAFFDAYNLSRSQITRRKSPRKKTVTFGAVTVHEHPIIVGCNPAVSSGVPLTIGWYRVSTTEMPLKVYEAIRRPERVSHRELLRQHPLERYALLQNLGFSRQELHEAELSANKIREFREQSYLDNDYKIDEKLRKRLLKLYELSRRRQQKLSKPVLSTMFRRIIGGVGKSDKIVRQVSCMPNISITTY